MLNAKRPSKTPQSSVPNLLSVRTLLEKFTQNVDRAMIVFEIQTKVSPELPGAYPQSMSQLPSFTCKMLFHCPVLNLVPRSGTLIRGIFQNLHICLNRYYKQISFHSK